MSWVYSLAYTCTFLSLLFFPDDEKWFEMCGSLGLIKFQLVLIWYIIPSLSSDSL